MTDTQDDCRRAYEEWRKQQDGYPYAPPDPWKAYQAGKSSSPSAAGDVDEQLLGQVIGQAVAEGDVAGVIARLRPYLNTAQPNVDELVRELINAESWEVCHKNNGAGAYVAVIQAKDVFDIIRKWAEGGVMKPEQILAALRQVQEALRSCEYTKSSWERGSSENFYFSYGKINHAEKQLPALIAAVEAMGDINGETSDGYHTFNELYEHRHALFSNLATWKSRLHADGTMFEGWFIAGKDTPKGQVTYHIPLRLWDAFKVPELPNTPEWDGHTSNDVIERLYLGTPPAQPQELAEDEREEIIYLVQNTYCDTQGKYRDMSIRTVIEAYEAALKAAGCKIVRGE